MNYLTNLFGSGNAAGGMRMPPMGQGMDLYGGQPSSNLGMTMPRNAYASADTGTGIMPPSSFGEMPANFDWKSALGAMQALGGLMGQPEQQAPMPQMELTPMQASQLPMGSNQSYEDLLKMYGVRTGGLLG
jgi:hypothetical protein